MTLSQISGLVALVVTIGGAGWQLRGMQAQIERLEVAVTSARADIQQLESYILEFHLAR